ncbi:MAG TPA: RNA 2',3'-cyclic phosphodiesterase [Burkholderiales bacterium]|nr:RNA 2',3'-cyclic phosphodiesterase [Burkholderiales bacterium]
MRLFFALWPPRETAQALADWAAEVRKQAGGKVTATENIHLTLAFLGDADADAALQAARRVQGRRHQLPIETAKYVRRNEMVWVAPVAMPAELAELVQSLHTALRAHSFRLEERPFAAHVTLIRKARQPTSLPPLPAVAWPVREFALISSRTSSKGSTYEPVELIALR